MFKKPHLGISGGLFCDLSSLFTRCWLVHASLFAPVPSIFSSGHPSRFQSTLSCASPLWDRTIAFFGPLILIVVVSLFSLLFALFRSLSLGPAAAALVLAVASACFVAASAAAFAARHACCVCASFFFVGVLCLSTGDLIATVMALHSGRSPQGEGRRKCDTSSIPVDAEVCVCISSQLPLATSLQMISN